jgi:hypothetical protein
VQCAASRLLVCAVAIVAIACGRRRGPEITASPEEKPRRAPVETPAPSAWAARVSSLVGHAGERVSVRGRHSPRTRPKVESTVAGKTPIGLALEGNPMVIVAYVERGDLETARGCLGSLLVEGDTIVVRGLARHGGTTGVYAEPQLDVTRLSCEPDPGVTPRAPAP